MTLMAGTQIQVSGFSVSTEVFRATQVKEVSMAVCERLLGAAETVKFQFWVFTTISHAPTLPGFDCCLTTLSVQKGKGEGEIAKGQRRNNKWRICIEKKRFKM